ncbi:MAG: ISL3 family transposase [Planctomycetota bacterium]
MCGQKTTENRKSVYDHLEERMFEFVPIWGIPVLLLYAMRRVACTDCGVRVEKVPWAVGKSRLTIAFACYLAEWGKDMSWSKVAQRFKTTWYHVYESIKYVVNYGKEHRALSGIKALGIDEIAWRQGHKYLTLVYQIDEGSRRLLWIGRDRTEKTLTGFFDWFQEKRTKRLKYICSDMWKPYLKVIRAKAGNALNILDRFHIMANLNKALDEVRRQEAARLTKEGKDVVLKHTRWCILKRVKNLTGKQCERLSELLKMNLKTVKAYLMKEDFQRFWEYRSAIWAGKFMDGWCGRVRRTRIEPLKKMARSLETHRPLLLNWFKAKGEYSSGIVEGLNNKAKTTIKMAYGYRHVETLEVALYHTLGCLPVPKVTHRFF